METSGSSPVIDSCFFDNCLNGHGGGLHISGGAVSVLASDFVGCVSTHTPPATYGGGGAIRAIGGATTIDYCSFKGCKSGQANVLMQEGGGSSMVRHSTIMEPSLPGGACFYNAYSTLTIEDSLFDSVGTTALFGWAPFTARRCTFRDLTGDSVMVMRYGTSLVQDCVFEHCQTSGALFGVTYSGVYSLGGSDFCSVSTPYFQGPWNNLGGNNFAAPCTCPTDFNSDGLTDGADLAFILHGWEVGEGSNEGDLSGDGDTDSVDLALLLASWGDC